MRKVIRGTFYLSINDVEGKYLQVELKVRYSQSFVASRLTFVNFLSRRPSRPASIAHSIKHFQQVSLY